MSGNADVSPPVRLSPVHVAHVRLGARFENRAGWEVPRVYTTTEAEAAAIRERVGVADISSVGKVLVRGNAENRLASALGAAPEAVGDVVDVVFRDTADLPVGGGYVARPAVDEFLLVTAAGVARRVMTRVEQWQTARYEDGDDSRVNIAHRTSGLAGVMLAGPHSTELLSKLSALPVAPSHVAQTSVAKVRAIVVRRDVTGVGSSTAAFELFVDRPFGEYLWDAVLDAGAEFGIRPFGTAALESVGVEF